MLTNASARKNVANGRTNAKHYIAKNCTVSAINLLFVTLWD